MARHRSHSIERPCVRGDPPRGTPSTWPKRFRSTPLREGRLPKAAGLPDEAAFRSTPLREGRPRTGTVVPLVS